MNVYQFTDKNNIMMIFINLGYVDTAAQRPSYRYLFRLSALKIFAIRQYARGFLP